MVNPRKNMILNFLNRLKISRILGNRASELNSSIFNKNGRFPTVFDPGKDLYFEITPKFGVFVNVTFSKFRKRRFL